MFSDTITISINSVDKDLKRINQDKYSSEYFLRESTQEFRLNIRHTKYADKVRGQVDRHNFELINTVYAVAPATVPTVRKCYTVLENAYSDAITDVANFALGQVGFANSGNLTKLINWES